jgi:hypothetical protein
MNAVSVIKNQGARKKLRFPDRRVLKAGMFRQGEEGGCKAFKLPRPFSVNLIGTALDAGAEQGGHLFRRGAPILFHKVQGFKYYAGALPPGMNQAQRA